MNQLKIKLLGGIMPEAKALDDAGLDLYAKEDQRLAAGERALIPLGLSAEFHPMLVAFLKERSGLASKGIYIHGGVIDSSYRGEWKVIVENASGEAWHIKRGDKVTQVVFLPCFNMTLSQTDALSESFRGGDGFGSTG